MPKIEKQHVLNALDQIELMIRDVREVIDRSGTIEPGERGPVGPVPRQFWDCELTRPSETE